MMIVSKWTGIIVATLLLSGCGGFGEYLTSTCAINRESLHIDELLGPDGRINRVSFNGIKDDNCAKFIESQLAIEKARAGSAIPRPLE
jgi:hypothetical protein